MKKRLKIVLNCLAVLTFSCSDSNVSNTEIVPTELVELDVDSVTVFIDSTEVFDSTITIDLAVLMDKIDMDTIYHVPFHLDSIYMSSFEEIEESTLTNLEVQYLSSNLIDNAPTEWSTYTINSFIEIDSMRLMDTYDDYTNTIDIGMIQESDANIHQKIITSKNNYILLWSITYSTVEACPYSSGTVVFGTLFNKNTAINTATLGENSGGGDAPYWANTFITSQINTTSILTSKHYESGGDTDDLMGEDIIDVIDEEFKISILDKGFEVINDN